MQNNNLQPELTLILNKQTFDLEVVWMEGYAHGDINLPETFNPYSQESSEYYYWSEGWEAGFYGDEPLFPEYQVDLDYITKLSSEGVTGKKNLNNLDNWLLGCGAIVGTVALFSGVILEAAA